MSYLLQVIIHEAIKCPELICAETPMVCRFVCHGLNADDNCVFRVKAVNSAGYSTYSAESEACIIKASIGKCLHSNP